MVSLIYRAFVLDMILVTITGVEHQNVSVPNCPITSSDWKNRSELLTCGRGEKYLCLPDSSWKFYELCRIEKALPKDTCPFIIWSGDSIDIETAPCAPEVSNCPNQIYVPTMLYKYPVCYIPPEKRARTILPHSNTITTVAPMSHNFTEGNEGVNNTDTLAMKWYDNPHVLQRILIAVNDTDTLAKLFVIAPVLIGALLCIGLLTLSTITKASVKWFCKQNKKILIVNTERDTSPIYDDIFGIESPVSTPASSRRAHTSPARAHASPVRAPASLVGTPALKKTVLNKSKTAPVTSKTELAYNGKRLAKTMGFTANETARSMLITSTELPCQGSKRTRLASPCRLYDYAYSDQPLYMPYIDIIADDQQTMPEEEQRYIHKSKRTYEELFSKTKINFDGCLYEQKYQSLKRAPVMASSKPRPSSV